MAVLFEPDEETPQGWRMTILGAIACFIGWHFGQIASGDWVVCSRCKDMYHQPEGLIWCIKRYLLPRRTIILYNLSLTNHILSLDKSKWDLRDLFIAYECIDCKFKTSLAQDIIQHQKTWHNWRTWWCRLKAS